MSTHHIQYYDYIAYHKAPGRGHDGVQVLVEVAARAELEERHGLLV